MTPQNPDYPVRLEVDDPRRLSRLLIFVKWLLAAPHYLVLIGLGLIAYLVLIVAWFAVIITGRYPRALFDYVAGVIRWGTRVNAYLLLQTDRYPPFTMLDDPSYPVRVEIDYPERIARWRPVVNWLLVIPAFVVADVLAFVAWIAAFLAWFAILVTGRYPEALFNAVTIYLRWNARTLVFTYWMTERYPPFVWA